MPLDGPRLAPLRGPATSLVVLLHGYGADGQDLIDIARNAQPRLPGTAFVAPHAPDPVPGMPLGRQWFPLQERSAQELWRGVTASGSAGALDAFLDAELARLSLPPGALALVGFSQGTMMALHAGLRRAQAPAAILGYSGLIVLPGGGPAAMTAEVTARPPVLLVHGDADLVIPGAALPASAAALRALGVPVVAELRPGLGHGIDPEGLAMGVAFLSRHLLAA